MKRTFFLTLTIILMIGIVSCEKGKYNRQPIAEGLKQVDSYTITGKINLLKDYEAINPDGSVNVVVETPAGTIEKWEVNYKGGLQVGFKNGKPKTVDYLAYPANYGIIPSTMDTLEMGGEGNPVDVILLGNAFPLGSVVNAKVIGMLKLFDEKVKNDYKLIAVPTNLMMGKLASIKDLKREYPGAMEILEIWFKNHKKGLVLKSEGYADANEAMSFLKKTAEAFKKLPVTTQK